MTTAQLTKARANAQPFEDFWTAMYGDDNGVGGLWGRLMAEGAWKPGLIVLEQRYRRSHKLQECCSCGATDDVREHDSRLVASVHSFYLCGDCE